MGVEDLGNACCGGCSGALLASAMLQPQAEAAAASSKQSGMSPPAAASCCCSFSFVGASAPPLAWSSEASCSPAEPQQAAPALPVPLLRLLRESVISRSAKSDRSVSSESVSQAELLLLSSACGSTEAGPQQAAGTAVPGCCWNTLSRRPFVMRAAAGPHCSSMVLPCHRLWPSCSGLSRCSTTCSMAGSCPCCLASRVACTTGADKACGVTMRTP